MYLSDSIQHAKQSSISSKLTGIIVTSVTICVVIATVNTTTVVTLASTETESHFTNVMSSLV